MGPGEGGEGGMPLNDEGGGNPYPDERRPLPSSQPQMPVDPSGNQPQEDEDEEKRPHPFNQKELASLAAHNTVPARCIRGLEGVDHSHLAKLLAARDDFEKETNPDKRIAKSAILISMAGQLDDRYHSHAKVWGRVVQQRPNAWSMEESYQFADAIDAQTMARYDAMSDEDLSRQLSAIPPSEVDQIVASNKDCTSSIGCPIVPSSATIDAAKQLHRFNKITIYQKNIYYDIFSTGYVERTSVISSHEAEEKGIPMKITKPMASSSCTQQPIFAIIPQLRRFFECLTEVSFEKTPTLSKKEPILPLKASIFMRVPVFFQKKQASRFVDLTNPFKVDYATAKLSRTDVDAVNRMIVTLAEYLNKFINSLTEISVKRLRFASEPTETTRPYKKERTVMTLERKKNKT